MYAANEKIKEFLVAKDFDVLSFDYRFYYFEDTPELRVALSTIPSWGRIWFSNLWGWT